MKLYGYFRSSAAYRCRIALNLKGLTPEYVSVHLRRGDQSAPEYQQLNPQGLVPSLEVDGHVITQSLAIIEWLDETYPEPALLPAEPLARAHLRAFVLAIACDIHPLNNLRVLKYLKAELGAEQTAIDAWYRHWVEAGLASCERLLRNDGWRGPYCFGETPTLADVCLVPQLYNARRFDADLSACPTLVAIDRLCSGHPAFAAAEPHRQPDAEP